MSRRRLWLAATIGAMMLCAAPSALAANTFHPRVRGALGLIPAVGKQVDLASGAITPAVYHGGSVMAGGVTIHTIFWGPQDKFEAGYESLVKQYIADVAHDSGASSNEFSVLTQYAMGTSPGGVTPGAYSISYNPATDSVDDTSPYPSSGQCASPLGVQSCVTDAQVQAEVQSQAGATTGLHDLWFVFLPSDVDECITVDVCGTNDFAGYHSVADFGGGPVVYAVSVDPSIEVGAIAPGQDPEGNPDAESTLQTAGHEIVEAMTDPEGVGWMDPNGFEVGDKCENPEYGTPLGTATDGSPYNQLINTHKYLIQEMWSNDDSGCVQQTSKTTNPLPLPQVNLTQYSAAVTGNIGADTSGVSVQVQLVRLGADGNPVTVSASPTVTTNGTGDWTTSLGSHAFGDDRDAILVIYSGTGAPTPHEQLILTGNGGNPFTESGWTGWTALDNGTFLTNNDPDTGNPSLTVGPCFQTGVLSYTVNDTTDSQSLNDNCNTQSDTADVQLGGQIAPGDVVTVSSNDNRAFSDPDGDSPNPNGGLVKLTVPVGEADAASQFVSPLTTWLTGPSGFPSCTADLELATVTCTGLVPQDSYTLTDGGAQASAVADDTGTAVGQFAAGALKGGGTVALSNGSQTLTTVHLASLKVNLVNSQTAISSGTCSAGEYYGPGLTGAPTNLGAGVATQSAGGAALTGEVCPSSGSAAGLSTSDIAQTDSLSGGTTQTEVPDVENTSPMVGETVYGAFTALAQSGLPAANNAVTPTDATSKVALYVAPAAGGNAKLVSANVDTTTGVTISGLAPGAYNAAWVLTDANDDTRTVTGRFIEAAATTGATGLRGPRGPRGARGPAGPKPRISCKLAKHNQIKCKVSYPKSKKGTIRIALTRGGKLAALGHARLSRGSANVTMRVIRRLRSGRWMMTVVLAQPRKSATTTTVRTLVS